MLTFSKKYQGIERTGRNRAQSLADRARKYVEKMPPAISGSGGHDALFAVASTLIHGFDLSEPEAWPILLEYNSRCIPPWSESELRHKLTSAQNLSRHSKSRGYLRGEYLRGDHVEQEYLPIPAKPEVIEWQVKPEPLPAKKSQARETTEAPKTLEPTDTEQDIEASRISQELAKLHRDGAITGPQHEEATFYARLIRDFGATYIGRIP